MKTVFLSNVETGSQDYVIVCLHSFVSSSNEKIWHETSADKIAVCEKTAGLRI